MKADPVKVANKIARWLVTHPDVEAVSLAMLHNLDPEIKKHEWEQALHVLNLRGVVEQKTYSMSGCWCCRSRNYWPVRKRI